MDFVVTRFWFDKVSIYCEDQVELGDFVVCQCVWRQSYLMSASHTTHPHLQAPYPDRWDVGT